jgi:hypothetical protein
MTTQQVKNLHPFVYSIKIIDLLEYPDISTVDITTFNKDNTYAVSPSLDIYGTKNSSDNSDDSALMKLQRLDLHEHYFSVTEPVDYDVCTILYKPGSYQSSAQDSSTHIIPITKARYQCDHLYVMAICRDSTLGLDLSNNTTVLLQKYLPINRLGDVSLQWEIKDLHQDLNYYDPVQYSTYNLHGMFAVSGEDYIYTYMHDGCVSLPSIYIHQINRITGALSMSLAVTGVGTSVNDLIIDKPSALENDIFVTINKSDGLWLGTVSLDIDTSFTSLQNLSSALIVTKPATYSYIDSSGQGTQVVIYTEPRNNVNKIFIAEAKTSVNNSIKTFNKPYTYTINQQTRFNVDDIDYNNQVYFDFASTRNPMNKDILYVAYFTSLGYIRVVKLYKYLPAGTTRNVYVILWATRADSTGSAFMVSDTPFVTTSTSGNGLHIVSDDVGDIYVFARQENGVVYVWKIKEYILDLGHSQISDITASPTTMTTFLADIEADYSIASQDIYIGFLPHLSDVIFSSITSNTTIDIVFKYINYDIFQSDEVDAAGLTIIDRFINALTDALTTLYLNSNITILNLNSSSSELIATTSTVTVSLPLTSTIKPCVLKGTEIVRCQPNGNQLVSIEKINEGDYVLNQDGIPVKVLRHTSNVISTDRWTSPYMIPANYFGNGQPYRTLFISGDHGILFKNKRLYPYQMPGAFRQTPVHTIVEYHHLLLDNHNNNYYFANGLLVESLHIGMCLT